MLTKIGFHEFHSSVMVLGVPLGTLALRDKAWSETGWNHGSAEVPETTIWADVWAYYNELEPSNDSHCHFYMVKEGERVSCGCISRNRDRRTFSLQG